MRGVVIDLWTWICLLFKTYNNLWRIIYTWAWLCGVWSVPAKCHTRLGKNYKMESTK